MKRAVFTFLVVSFLFSYSCDDLMKKYHTPNPETKTMKQLKRWIYKNLKNSPDEKKLLRCLLENAADNPNQVSVAGE